MRRVCFTLQVRPERLAEYRRRHASVWPDMLAALRDDGLLVGYFLTPDLDAAQAAMEATEVNARWQAEMAPFFADLPGARPDRGFVVLDEVFHLEDQLRDRG